MTSSYDSLGIKRVINANATLTKLGGSLMPEEVIQAMVEASKTFVEISINSNRLWGKGLLN